MATVRERWITSFRLFAHRASSSCNGLCSVVFVWHPLVGLIPITCQARLSEQMKERRKLRKARGRTPSNATNGGSAAPFTGLGSVAAAAAAALAPSSSSGSSSRAPAALELSSLTPSGGGGGNGGSGASSSSAFGTGAHTHAASPSASPGGGIDGDAADRYAGMLSEEVEAELERAEQKREIEDAQAAVARAMTRA